MEKILNQCIFAQKQNLKKIKHAFRSYDVLLQESAQNEACSALRKKPLGFSWAPAKFIVAKQHKLMILHDICGGRTLRNFPGTFRDQKDQNSKKYKKIQLALKYEH